MFEVLEKDTGNVLASGETLEEVIPSYMTHSWSGGRFVITGPNGVVDQTEVTLAVWKQRAKNQL